MTAPMSPGAADRRRVRAVRGSSRPPGGSRTSNTAPRPWAGSRTPWLYLAPALVVLGGLLAYPVYQLGLISLFHYTQAQVSGGEPTTFEGFGNYARLFGDEATRALVLKAPNPGAAKALGRQVLGFKEDAWLAHRERTAR